MIMIGVSNRMKISLVFSLLNLLLCLIRALFLLFDQVTNTDQVSIGIVFETLYGALEAANSGIPAFRCAETGTFSEKGAADRSSVIVCMRTVKVAC